MGYTKKVLAVTSTNGADFFELFINELTAATSRITAGTVSKYEISGSGTLADCTLSVQGGYSIAASYRYVSGSTSQGFIDMTVSYDQTSLASLSIRPRATRAGTEVPHNLRFILSENDNVLALRLTDHYTVTENKDFITCDFLFGNEKKIFASNSKDSSSASIATTNYPALGGTIKFAANGNEIVSHSRLGYALTEPGKIELIESKVFTSSGIKSEEMTSLYDSSTVAVDGTYPVGNVTYYAVDEHTVMTI